MCHLSVTLCLYERLGASIEVSVETKYYWENYQLFIGTLPNSRVILLIDL